jgi:hypothetical protein
MPTDESRTVGASILSEASEGVGVDCSRDVAMPGDSGGGVSTYAAGSCMSSDSSTPAGSSSVPGTGVKDRRISPGVRFNAAAAACVVVFKAPWMAEGSGAEGVSAGRGREAFTVLSAGPAHAG